MIARTVAALLWRTLGCALVWWALTEGDPAVWAYSLVVVPLAVAASWRVLPPGPLRVPLPGRLLAFARLFWWFLARSFLGGVDVARRSLSRPLDLEPGAVEYRLRLPPGLARVAVVNLMTLSPGTLSTELSGDVLRLHVLDTSMNTLEHVAELEERIFRLIG